MISTDSTPVLKREERQTGKSNAALWAWAAVAAWVGVIFFSSTSLASQWAENAYDFVSKQLFSSRSPDLSSFDLLHLLADKGFHVTLFCVLAMLLWLALPAVPRKAWMILLGGAIVGSCSEILQRFFPDRDPAIRDVIINIGGTTLGVLLCFGAKRLLRPRSPGAGAV